MNFLKTVLNNRQIIVPTLLYIFSLQENSLDHKYFLFISNHDNENISKNRSETLSYRVCSLKTFMIILSSIARGSFFSILSTAYCYNNIVQHPILIMTMTSAPDDNDAPGAQRLQIVLRSRRR